MNKTNLFVDFGIFAAFLVVAEPGLTGLPIHEWLGVAFAAAIIIHLLLHWKWVVSITTNFFKKLFHESRLQYVVDAVLFVSMTAVIFSGLLISRNVMSVFGLQLAENHAWRAVHVLSANTTVAMVALHTALHWKWVVNMTRRYLVSPVASLFRGRTPQVPALNSRPVPVRVEVVRK
ncbi:MAG TPA: DUF4405 domain-containing protein [Anaerolineaceae bacterium]